MRPEPQHCDYLPIRYNIIILMIVKDNLGFQVDKSSCFSLVAVIDSKVEIQKIKDKDKEEG